MSERLRRAAQEALDYYRGREDRLSNVIGCCCCLNLTGERVEAVTMANGYAACEKHVDLVSQPGFDLTRLRKPGRKL